MKNVIMGGLASLSLVTSAYSADELEKENNIKRLILKREVSKVLKEELKEVGVPDKQIETILKKVNDVVVVNGKKRKVIARTMVVGATGSLEEVKKGGVIEVDVSKVLSEVKDSEIKKILDENRNAIISGEVVIIDGEGNRIERALGEGDDLNEMVRNTLEDMNINIQTGAVGIEKDDNKKDSATKIEELQEEMAAQRLLLEQILEMLK